MVALTSPVGPTTASSTSTSESNGIVDRDSKDKDRDNKVEKVARDRSVPQQPIGKWGLQFFNGFD